MLIELFYLTSCHFLTNNFGKRISFVFKEYMDVLKTHIGRDKFLMNTFQKHHFAHLLQKNVQKISKILIAKK